MATTMDVIWEADLPLELIEAAQSLHDQGPTPAEARDLDCEGSWLLAALYDMPADAGLREFAEQAMSDEEYESLLLSAAALTCGGAL